MVYAPGEIPAHAVQALTPAFDRSCVHDAALWVERCVQNLAQLWRKGELWAITEVIETKAGRAVHIVAMAGTYDRALVSEIEQWGREMGCGKCFFTGRKGWIRAVPDYRLRTVTLEKEL
jgi:hypothetical protein